MNRLKQISDPKKIFVNKVFAFFKKKVEKRKESGRLTKMIEVI